MESIKLSERVSGDDEVPEFDVPLNLTTINDDCRELIFEHLGLQDLLNIAETSKRLHSAACAVFKRKYGRAKIDFHHVGYGRYTFKFNIPLANYLLKISQIVKVFLDSSYRENRIFA